MRLSSFLCLLLAIFNLCIAQNAFSQNTTTGFKKESLKSDPATQQGTPDLALVSCAASWGAPGQVTITWTAQNKGTANCRLVGARGESLVSYIVEGSPKDKATASGSDWVLLAESSPLIVQTKELRPGATATGSFTFTGSTRESLVCYRVTLNTDNIGSADSNPTNNIYIGLIPTKKQ